MTKVMNPTVLRITKDMPHTATYSFGQLTEI